MCLRSRIRLLLSQCVPCRIRRLLSINSHCHISILVTQCHHSAKVSIKYPLLEINSSLNVGSSSIEHSQLSEIAKWLWKIFGNFMQPCSRFILKSFNLKQRDPFPYIIRKQQNIVSLLLLMNEWHLNLSFKIQSFTEK